MSRACIRCQFAVRPTPPQSLRYLASRSISTALPRYGNEGTSPKAKALEVYQVPKSNIPGRTLLTQPTQEDLREKPKLLMWAMMKLFRTRPMRKAMEASNAKIVMQEYYALCATRATSDGDETSTGFWYDGKLIMRPLADLQSWPYSRVSQHGSKSPLYIFTCYTPACDVVLSKRADCINKCS